MTPRRAASRVPGGGLRCRHGVREFAYIHRPETCTPARKSGYKGRKVQLDQRMSTHVTWVTDLGHNALAFANHSH